LQISALEQGSAGYMRVNTHILPATLTRLCRETPLVLLRMHVQYLRATVSLVQFCIKNSINATLAVHTARAL
jgi:hypothetical protein